MKEFIEFLVKNNAITFGEFILKSGRKSPYFINTGVLSDGKLSYELGKFYAMKILQAFPQAEAIYGPAYKGIPLAISISLAMYKEYKKNLGWIFDRKEKKTHGDSGSFIGCALDVSAKIVLVDDVMTTGETKIEAIKKIEEGLEAELVGIVVAVDRQERGKRKSAIEEFSDNTGIIVEPIVKISEVFEYLKNREIDGTIYVNDEIYEKFIKYKKEFGSE
ncbi:MAG: orotate phosphoribosyltransferase [Candidatus Micrarchaeia archaeon]